MNQDIKIKIDTYFSRLQELAAEKQQYTQQSDELYEQQKASKYPETSRIMNERSVIMAKIKTLDIEEMAIQNAIKALQNEGVLVTIQDKKGETYENIPDFSNVDTDNISFDEESILDTPAPIYIPIIDEKKFAENSYVFDAIRWQKDKYLLATTRHKEPPGTDSFTTRYDEVYQKPDYVIITLDQLVLTADYYTSKEKAKNRRSAEESTKRSEEFYDKLPEERRLRHFAQANYYNSLPAAVKKKVTKEEWDSLDLAGKENLYKPFKKYGPKKIVSKLAAHQMYGSFHKMYERFVNPEATTLNQQGQPDPKGRYGNREVFDYWYIFSEMLDFKIKDIRIQREELSEARKAALETSFGNINTSDVLKPKHGLLIKRQNGDAINATETEQIDLAYDSIKLAFGDLSPSFEKYGIKISHTGKRYVFASKAIGAWVAAMGTVAVSDKYGDDQFRSTFAHELGHFIDYAAGQTTGKRYASDDYESTAGVLAFAFRNNMNKPKKDQTEYINATKECFARAFQQYYGIEVYGETASITHSYIELGEVQPLFNADNFVGEKAYYEIIKPLIDKFLLENSFIFGGDNSERTELLQAIEGLELLYSSSSNDSERDEILDVINALKLLK